MTKASRNWYLVYLHVSYNYGALEGRIICKEFTNELDLLVWASKNRVPKAVGQHFVFSPEGMSRLPTELYGRIDVLRKELIDKEAYAEERAIARKEQAERERREARQRKEQQRAGAV